MKNVSVHLTFAALCSINSEEKNVAKIIFRFLVHGRSTPRSTRYRVFGNLTLETVQTITVLCAFVLVVELIFVRP